MALLIVLFVCGVIVAFTLAIFPAWNDFALKHVLKLIEALGVILAWGFWILIGYLLLGWRGLFSLDF
jgi:hypothetical protein